MRWILLGLALVALFVGALVIATLTSSPSDAHFLPPPGDAVVLPAPPPRLAPPARPAPPAVPAAPIAEEPFVEPPAEGDSEPLDAGPLYPVSSRGIREVLLSRQVELSACYARWLSSTPGAPREVMVSVRVMEMPSYERGVIDSVRVDENQTSGHVQMGRCVKDALKTLRFERPGGGWTTVAFPFKAATPR